MPVPGDQMFLCPNCGEEVRVGAPSCPSCGSDDDTGWSEEAEAGYTDYGGGYGGNDDFDYDEFVRRELGGDPERPTLPDRKELVTGAVALVLIFALLVWLLGL